MRQKLMSSTIPGKLTPPGLFSLLIAWQLQVAFPLFFFGGASEYGIELPLTLEIRE